MKYDPKARRIESTVIYPGNPASQLHHDIINPDQIDLAIETIEHGHSHVGGRSR